MPLPEKIRFFRCQLEGTPHHPGEDGGTVVSKIQTPFTTSIAEQLGLDKAQFWKPNGHDHQPFDKISSPLPPILDCHQVRLKGDKAECREKPDKIQSFSVSREKGEKGMELVLKFNAHFSGQGMGPVQEFGRLVNQDTFTVTLVMSQQELFVEDPDEPEPEDVEESEEDDEQLPLVAPDLEPEASPAPEASAEESKSGESGEKSYPEPNESGIYPSDTAEHIRHTSGKAVAQIDVLEVADGWVSGVSAAIKLGSARRNHAVPLTGPAHLSQSGAKEAAALSLYEFLGRLEAELAAKGSTGSAGRAACQTVMSWAAQMIGKDALKSLQDRLMVERGASEEPEGTEATEQEPTIVH